MVENIYLLIVLNIIIFGIGYIVGKINSYSPGKNGIHLGPLHGVDNTHNTHNKVKIDQTKFVTEISVEGIEKKYDKLGETQLSADNIEVSVNKLKNLKR